MSKKIISAESVKSRVCNLASSLFAMPTNLVADLPPCEMRGVLRFLQRLQCELQLESLCGESCSSAVKTAPALPSQQQTGDSNSLSESQLSRVKNVLSAMEGVLDPRAIRWELQQPPA